MSITFASYVTRITAALGVLRADIDYPVIIPAIIDAAEQRCYRELNLLTCRVSQDGTLAVSTRAFTLPSVPFGRFVSIDSILLLAGTGQWSLVPVSRDYLEWAWPNDVFTVVPSLPQYFAMVTDQTIIVGPPAQGACTLRVTGPIRPTPLSSTTTTFLTNYLPDLFVAASLVAGADYVPGADKMKFEAEYQRLFASANLEEMTKRFQAGPTAPPAASVVAAPGA